MNLNIYFAHFKEYTDGNVITSRAKKGLVVMFFSPESGDASFFVLYRGKIVIEKGRFCVWLRWHSSVNISIRSRCFTHSRG